MKITRDQAIYLIAWNIWQHGNSKGIGTGVLVPSDMTRREIFGKACDLLIDSFEYTHYDIHWHKPGKIVKIRFYRGEELGAAIINESHFVAEYLVNVDPDNKEHTIELVEGK